MTEDQIEQIVSSRTDRADMQFLAGDLTQEEYDRRLNDIVDWAEQQYAESRDVPYHEWRDAP